jgi:hypothetical protein
MNAKIQFGENTVQVKGRVFHLTPYALQVLREWYNWSVNYDTEAPEEFRTEEVEYFAKAFEMLKPQSHDEAFDYLTMLENAFVQTDYKVKEIIDRIYAKRNHRKELEKAMKRL